MGTLLKSWGKSVLTALIIGLGLAGLWALKQGLWQGRLITWYEVLFFVVATILAIPVCHFLEIRKRRSRDDLAASGRPPPASAWADYCLSTCGDNLSFERWVPVDGVLGTSSLEVEQVLEDRTRNHHRAILLVKGTPAQEISAADVDAALQTWCRAQLRPSRLQGLAIGIVLDLGGNLAPDAETLLQIVDYKSRFPATVQWIAWIDRARMQAAAVRTWMDVATMPCFSVLCTKLETDGFRLDCRKRPPTGMLKAALKIDRAVPWWLRILGP